MSNDPTAKLAANNVTNEVNGDRREHRRFLDLLHILITMCELSNFEIEGEIRLRDKRTGKHWVSSK